MSADQGGPQAARLASLYVTRYGWYPEEVTRKIVDAVERQYRPASATWPTAMSEERLGAPRAISEAVSCATAPPHPRAGADEREVTLRRSPSIARQLPLDRG
jgi:hypothetical protein